MLNNWWIVDADAHVNVPPAVWDDLDEEYAARKPYVVTLAGDATSRGPLNSFWVCDGRTIPNPIGPWAIPGGTPPTSTYTTSKVRYSVPSQTLTDPAARLADLDRLAIDVQVVFPGVAFAQMTPDALFEAALYRSYNRYVADACRDTGGRLQWAGLVPLRHLPAAVAEIERVKALGGAALVFFGTAGEQMLGAPALKPFWAAAEAAGLPLCIHVGRSFPALAEVFESPFAATGFSITLPILMAFFSLIEGGVLDRHPGLRFAFLEAGSLWLPFLVDRMDEYYRIMRMKGHPWTWRLPADEPSTYLGRGQLYVTPEADDRWLPDIMQLVGEDHLMYASDIPHVELRDNAAEEYLERDDLSDPVKRKILGENAGRFYGLARPAVDR
jgi:predicted TIM-barrel fold metal-dependent hydrolase